MTSTLRPGLAYELSYTVPSDKTVPHLYPDVPEFQKMPQVFATGFMVGLVEWACMLAVRPHLELPDQLTVGTHVNLSHEAATPPGLTVTVRVALSEVEGRRLVFDVAASDGIDTICRGSHERYVVDADRFNTGISKKLSTSEG